MTALLCVKNWADHQHYRDRQPAWIKLHKRLLDDYEFHMLPVASKALAPCIWLLASEHADGKIPLDEKKIAFRLHMTVAEVRAALNPLIEAGFLYVEQDASAPLAEPEQVASLEKEKEEEIQEQKDSSAPKRATDAEEFERWYAGYPRKIGRGQALKAFKAARKKADLAALMAGRDRYAAELAGKDQGFIAHPATWLNGERWLDAPGSNAPAVDTKPPPKANGHVVSAGGLANSEDISAQVRRRRAEKIKEGDPSGGAGFALPKRELQRMLDEGLLTVNDLEQAGLAQ